jgi:carboxylesterase type B
MGASILGAHHTSGMHTTFRYFASVAQNKMFAAALSASLFAAAQRRVSAFARSDTPPLLQVPQWQSSHCTVRGEYLRFC